MDHDHDNENDFSYFDTHIHSIFLSNFEIELLMTNGMKKCITTSYCSFRPKYASAYDFLFDWQTIRETERLKQLGVESFSCIGIHPRSIPIKEGEMKNSMEIIQKHLIEQKNFSKPNIIGLGEIGLELGDTLEINTFKNQLEIANNYKLPVIIHTPSKNKKEITKLEIEILQSYNIKIILDHITQENFLDSYDSGYFLGFTMQKNKLNSKIAAELLFSYDLENRIVLNSDVCDENNEMGGIVNFLTHLEDKKVNKTIIEKIKENNGNNLFGL